MTGYLPLARKYRPKTLKDLYGQDILRDVFTAGIESGNLHHAFLFYGTRGVGKTTTARILALSLNCQKSDKPTTEPCLECKACKATLTNTNPDIIEFDAASNTGVDSIRRIIEECRYPNSFCRYKIYIIDEVHMLSNSAFNAFLKLLEEPPLNVKFIFATTEVKKIPMTILSRCQKFMLNSATSGIIKEYLRDIYNKEGYEFDEQALDIIAKYANGSFRDSLSLSETVLMHSGYKKITHDVAQKVLAIPNEEVYFELFKDLVNADVKDALSIFEKVKDFSASELINGLMFLINEAMIAIAVKENQDSKINELIENGTINMPKLHIFWDVCIQCLESLRVYQNSNLIQVFIIRVCYAVNMPTVADVTKMLEDDSVEKILQSFPGSKILS
jgi:DNA polymerase-3 subunit gamma/tau